MSHHEPSRSVGMGSGIGPPFVCHWHLASEKHQGRRFEQIHRKQTRQFRLRA